MVFFDFESLVGNFGPSFQLRLCDFSGVSIALNFHKVRFS